jgi:hypothetical protein
MNLAKALKEKKKITREIGNLKDLINRNNSYTEPNFPKFDVYKLEEDLISKTEELIDLKCKITKANIGINDKIYTMAELKGLVNFYKYLNTNEKTTYDINRNETITKAKISEVYTIEKVRELEKEIQDLQDEIDYYNQTTEI